MMTFPSNPRFTSMITNIGESDELTIEELRILYEFLEHQYVSYDNIELIKIVRKIQKLIEENNAKQENR